MSDAGSRPVARRFRFAAVLYHAGNGTEWARKVRLAQELGYDAISQPHLPGLQAPLTAFASAAIVSERLRLSPVVLNPTAWHPQTLRREAATLDRLSEGRLEIGLGLGVWQYDDFRRAHPEGRVAHLEQTIDALMADTADDGLRFAQQPSPPLHIAGAGERVMEIAAQRADIFNFYTTDRPLEGAQGIALIEDSVAEDGLRRFRELAGDRYGGVELCTGVEIAVTNSPRRLAAKIQPLQAPHLSVDQVLASPKTAFGTVPEVEAYFRDCRERYGYSYFLIGESSMVEFQPVLERLVGS